MTAYNNICWATGSISGTFTRDYNDIASNTETHGISGNPDFVSTTPPYIDTDFEITSGSPTRAAGTNLHSISLRITLATRARIPRSISVRTSSRAAAHRPPPRLSACSPGTGILWRE